MQTDVVYSSWNGQKERCLLLKPEETCTTHTHLPCWIMPLLMSWVISSHTIQQRWDVLFMVRSYDHKAEHQMSSGEKLNLRCMKCIWTKPHVNMYMSILLMIFLFTHNFISLFKVNQIYIPQPLVHIYIQRTFINNVLNGNVRKTFCLRCYKINVDNIAQIMFLEREKNL